MRFICKKNRESSQNLLRKISKEDFKKLCFILHNLGCSDNTVIFELINKKDNINSCLVYDNDGNEFRFDINENKLPVLIEGIYEDNICVYNVFDNNIEELSHGYVCSEFRCDLYSDNKYLTINNGNTEYSVSFSASKSYKPNMEDLLLEIYSEREDFNFQKFFRLCSNYIDSSICNELVYIVNINDEMVSNVVFNRGKMTRYDVTDSIPNGTRRVFINGDDVIIQTNTMEKLKYKDLSKKEVEKIKRRFY